MPKLVNLEHGTWHTIIIVCLSNRGMAYFITIIIANNIFASLSTLELKFSIDLTHNFTLS